MTRDTEKIVEKHRHEMASSASPAELDSLRLICRKLESQLENVKHEISTYPSPIAGCDSQFNYLLEIRAVLANALSTLRTVEHNKAISPIVRSQLKLFSRTDQIWDMDAIKKLLG